MVENGTKVSAYNIKTFVFLPEKSVGDPAVDSINTVNIPAWVSLEGPGPTQSEEKGGIQVGQRRGPEVCKVQTCQSWTGGIKQAFSCPTVSRL